MKKPVFGDYLIILGFASMSMGIWLIDRRYSLIFMGAFLMIAGALSLRGG